MHRPLHAAAAVAMAQLPTYEHFRRHAAFVPDYADFLLTGASLRKLLSELDLLWGTTSLGTGDLTLLCNATVGQPVLAAAAAGRHAATAAATFGKPCVTFTAAQRICSILHGRAERVRDTFTASLASASAAAVNRTSPARTSTISNAHSLSSSAISRHSHVDHQQQQQAGQHQESTASHAQPQAAPTLQQAHQQQPHQQQPHQQQAPSHPHASSRGAHTDLLLAAITASISPAVLSHNSTLSRNTTLSRSTTFKQQTSQKSAATVAAILHDDMCMEPLTHEEALTAAHVGSATHWWDIESPGRNPTSRPTNACPQRTLPIHGSMRKSRPRSAAPRTSHDTAVTTCMGWPCNPAHLSMPFNAVDSCEQAGTHGFSAKLLQAVMRPPACEFAAVARLLHAIKGLQQSSGNPEHVQGAVKDAVLAWEQAMIDKMVRAASKQKGGGNEADDASSPSLPRLPADGTIWLMVVCALSCLAQSKQDIAAELLDSALECLSHASASQDNVITAQHHYHVALQVCKGMVQLTAGRFDDAARTFEQAHKQGMLVACTTLDPVALRNAAAAANNHGVALLQLGHGSAAVRCFKAAAHTLRHPPHWGTLSMSEELAAAKPVTSAAKATKQRPSTAKSSGAAIAGGDNSTTSGAGAAEQQVSSPLQLAAASANLQPTPQPPLSATPLATAGGQDPSGLTASVATAAQPRRSSIVKKTTASALPPAYGLDAAAAQLTVSNLQGALRLSFAAGVVAPNKQWMGQAGQQQGMHLASCSRRSSNQRASESSTVSVDDMSQYGAVSTDRCRPLTAPSVDLAACRSMQQHRHQAARNAPAWPDTIKPQLREFLTHAITQQPSCPPACTPAWARHVSSAEEGAGKGKSSSKASAGRKDDNKGGSRVPSHQGYTISWTTDYYSPPIYSVANVKAEAPKVKKSVKKKKGDKKLIPSTSSILRMLPQGSQV